MSADNGIYILKAGSQYRVKPLSAIENLYWHETHHENRMNPKEVVNMFGDCKWTYDAEKAIRLAMHLSRKCHTEYGVVVLDTKKSWGSILKVANRNNDLLE